MHLSVTTKRLLLSLIFELVRATATWKLIMKKTERIANELRSANEDLLFDKGAKQVTTMETAERLSEGDEYFDLEQFVQDVL